MTCVRGGDFLQDEQRMHCPQLNIDSCYNYMESNTSETPTNFALLGGNTPSHVSYSTPADELGICSGVHVSKPWLQKFKNLDILPAQRDRNNKSWDLSEDASATMRDGLHQHVFARVRQRDGKGGACRNTVWRVNRPEVVRAW